MYSTLRTVMTFRELQKSTINGLWNEYRYILYFTIEIWLMQVRKYCITIFLRKLIFIRIYRIDI